MKRIILSITAALGLIAPFAVPVAVSAADADIDNSLTCGANLTFSGGECTSEDADGSTVDNIVTNVINIISLVVGVVAVVMIIIAGLRYVTSGGDSGKVTSAKDTIMYAVIGLVVVAVAQLIVQFVVRESTKTTTTD